MEKLLLFKSLKYSIVILLFSSVQVTFSQNSNSSNNQEGCYAFINQNSKDFGKTNFPDPTPGLYLYPYNLHLTMNSTSTEPLVIVDEFGEIVTGTLQFYGYNTSLISISSDGYVTGLRQENASEIGTWISATIDGKQINNTCVARVLSQDYNFNFISETTLNTVLYYPLSINGEDIQQYVVQYEIPIVNQYTYEIQSELMDLQPFIGNKQILEIDFGETEQQRVCGISGNPVRLGWNISGNEWQNCFLVPFTPPRSPQWFIIAHEIGHNFTGASGVFVTALGTFVYSEGVASTLGIECYEKMLLSNVLFPLENDAKLSIQGQVDQYKNAFNNSFNNWINNGANFNQLTPDIVDAIYYNYKTLSPENFGKRFFIPLQYRFVGELTPILNDVTNNGINGKHTFYAALISAVIKEDVSEEFISLYNYPIVQSLFDDAFPILMNLMDTYALSVEEQVFSEQDVLFQNYPNPFSTTTVIKYVLKNNLGANVNISVYDLLGRHIKTIVNKQLSEGEHYVEFDAYGLASGVYICKIKVGSFEQSRKMVLLR